VTVPRACVPHPNAGHDLVSGPFFVLGVGEIRPNVLALSENSAYERWKYAAVRRIALFLEDSLYVGLNWAVFEPDGT
jgi:hypothetical protein